jgi:hypothetical protein
VAQEALNRNFILLMSKKHKHMHYDYDYDLSTTTRTCTRDLIIKHNALSIIIKRNSNFYLSFSKIDQKTYQLLTIIYNTIQIKRKNG